jgi:intracellular sulfur oxidation DsrE/DsrF family protein
MSSTLQKRSDLLSNGANLQLLTLLSHVLKSGKVNLSSSNEKVLQLTVEPHQIDLNIVNNKFLKEVLKDSMGIRSFRELLRELRNAAEELKSKGVTITVSYKAVTVLTLGSDAKPNFSQLITGTTEIEINNLRKLIQMGLF